MLTIALIGGGPASLFMFKRILEANLKQYNVHIFEANDKLGAGLPYSKFGASTEHITNVSDNEIPEIRTNVKEWLSHAEAEILQRFDMDEVSLNEYKVLPRLLFGEYLAGQFDLLLEEAKKSGIHTEVHFNSLVVDVIDNENTEKVSVMLQAGKKFTFDKVIICTGHSFPQEREKKLKGWFDSPYPPEKLTLQIDFEVAIRGASLTAVDAVRTLARANGNFTHDQDDFYTYHLNEESKGFKIKLFSLGGLLPGIRIHLEESQPDPTHLISEEEITDIKNKNKGFIPLDYLFEVYFKKILKAKQPELYLISKGKSIEEFMDFMMEKRRKLDAFKLFLDEYQEAERSIHAHESIPWKETLTDLSYVINYAIKHFSAEDMLRFKRSVSPLIALIIAFVPQSSAREMLALHKAGLLEVVNVDKDSSVEPAELGGCIYSYRNEKKQEEQKHYNIFIDAVGQKPFYFKQLPFEGLINKNTLSPAFLNFADQKAAQKEIDNGNKDVQKDALGNFSHRLPGVLINDHFQPLNQYGVANPRLYIMAVPFISGLNPDYSGLDFCEVSSEKIVNKIIEISENQQL
ncbi:FAD-NAD(P)-binding protein [Algoriphagus ratkowskyi]|uniref:FAD-NAD(P)-binding protein n=1 Tax=Algoriphagus ratkowskyi TaxID=57028 RepID=A0A2W7QYA3_9BACT|nr:FAD/NAD(P)-binding protein [Algoriphagus ratkowskyi]PZX53513.1 FAD-NAD(P)-binding protein [Algoriphagus ratkowskyi]TXD76458.1 hypothetical protein ESW18_15725 [Algoriphagus ratkowskyi]